MTNTAYTYLYKGVNLMINGELPEIKLANAEIAKLLIMFKGFGHDAIMAEAKLDKILTLSNDKKIELALKTYR